VLAAPLAAALVVEPASRSAGRLEPPHDQSAVLRLDRDRSRAYFNSSQITVAALRAKSACEMFGTPVGASAAR